MKKFKNKFKGERVFIVGNGPSLNNTPLDGLMGEYSFGMNRVSLLYEKTDWRPTFFICTTTNVNDVEWRKDILESVELGIDTFVWDELKQHFVGLNNVHMLNCTNGNEVVCDPPDNWWSYEASERVTKFGTSMIVALQIATYMGFNPIYIVGADMGFKKQKRALLRKLLKYIPFFKINNNDINHFHPSYGTPGLDAENLNMNMLAAHELSKRATLKIGVNIYNATVGGELEVYPRVNINEVLK
tara:strand:- start:2525 stop:3253 length:729 start_codon:yes stop_codon:yes gene_type:complete